MNFVKTACRSTLVLSFGLGLGSCMKAPDTTVEKGPSVACETLDAQISTIRSQSVLSIKKNEFAYTESSTRLENLSAELTEQYGVTVIDRSEDAHQIQLLIREETREKDSSGSFKTSIKEGPATIIKGSTNVTSISSANLKEINFASRSFKALNDIRINSTGAFCQQKNDGSVKSFNNLVVSTTEILTPDAVAKHDNCGNLPNCARSLPAKVLQFDRWVPKEDGSELKITNYVTTSSAVPYFAAIMSQCVQYSWPVQGRQILVTACDDVKDFKFGD